MAEGFIRKQLAGDGAVFSAGVKPEPVNQCAVQVMGEIGIDISGHTSNHVNEYLDAQIDVALTVCDNARESCPIFPESVRTIHHNFVDPSKEEPNDEVNLETYRRTRDEIEVYCTSLISELRS